MRTLLIILLLAVLGCSQSSAPPLVATDVEVTRPMPGRGMSAGYMVLTNNTDEDIVLTRVASNAFARVEMHESSVTDGVARMRPVPQLAIPAGESIVLQRGGLHLMLMRPSGDTRELTLDFYAADNLMLSIAAQISAGDG